MQKIANLKTSPLAEIRKCLLELKADTAIYFGERSTIMKLAEANGKLAMENHHLKEENETIRRYLTRMAVKHSTLKEWTQRLEALLAGRRPKELP